MDVGSGEDERWLGWLAVMRLPNRQVVRRAIIELSLEAEPFDWLHPDGKGLRGSGFARRVAALRGWNIPWSAVESDLVWARKHGVGLVSVRDSDYPPLLHEIVDPPPAFLYRGAAAWDVPSVALVGSRRASRSGRARAEQLAFELSEAGLQIVSGMALGIDSAAHLGALRAGGATVAVLGSGLARPYPRQNLGLMERIAGSGSVLSEFPPARAPHPGNFPYRNRIISGLSLGVVVVEAARQSGSLVTARLAAEQGRDVFALPGPVSHPLHAGCHQLIKNGACLVEDVRDVFDALGTEWRALHRTPGAVGNDEARSGRVHGLGLGAEDAMADRVLEGVDYSPTSMDELVERTGLTPERVSAMLLALELQDRIRVEIDGTYVRI